MANYIIEGTITEITTDSEGITFQLSATEGFSLRKKEGKEYVMQNVLCNSEKKYVEDNKAPSHALTIPKESDFKLPQNQNFVLICVTALSSGKKVRIVFEEIDKNKDDSTKVLDNLVLSINSISILAD